MADNTRKIEITDDVLRTLVTEKAEIVEKGRELAKEMERLAAEHKKVHDEHDTLFSKLNAKKLKIIKRVRKVAEKLMNEYEVPVTVNLENDKLMFEVADVMADFKDSLKNFDKWKEAAPSKK